MSQRQQQTGPLKEALIQNALQAMNLDATLLLRRAAMIYKVSHATLYRRRAGTLSRIDCTPNSRKLDKIEEEVIVRHILDLAERGFPPRLAAVADIANSLRGARNLGHVSANWPSTFVKRRPKLKVRFNRKYDYKRALCKDPKVIQG